MTPLTPVARWRTYGNWALLNLLANGQQALLNLLAFGLSQQTRLGKHLGVGNRCTNIVHVQAPIVADAFGELFDPAVGRRFKDSVPRLLGH